MGAFIIRIGFGQYTRLEPNRDYMGMLLLVINGRKLVYGGLVAIRGSGIQGPRTSNSRASKDPSALHLN